MKSHKVTRNDTSVNFIQGNSVGSFTALWAVIYFLSWNTFSNDLEVLSQPWCGSRYLPQQLL